VSSETPNAPQTDENAPDRPEHGQGAAERPTDATADAGTDTDDHGASTEQEERIAALRKHVAELEGELHRERLARAYQLPDDVAARITGGTAEERQTDAKKLADVFHRRRVPLGRGGLDPTGESQRRATWPEAFRRARENRRNGRDGVTFTSDSRSSGEL
jgi:hypothetical protein